MNAKHYVSLSAAKKLKELGYDEYTHMYYNTLGELGFISRDFNRRLSNNSTLSKYDYISAPTLLEAMDWLEERGIYIELSWNPHRKKWWDTTIHRNRYVQDDTVYFLDRNECMQKAIEKALELL